MLKFSMNRNKYCCFGGMAEKLCLEV